MARSRAQRLLYLAADAGLSLYGGFRSRRTAFLAHERTPIADARTGKLIKVVGRLRSDASAFKAPISATPCLWYRAVAKRLDHGPLFEAVPVLGRLWFGEAITEEKSVDLFIDDDTGSALVDEHSVRFSLIGMRSGWSSNLPGAFAYGRGGAARRFLSRHGITEAGDTVIYHEVVLKEGDTVAVLGRPRIELDPTARGDFRTPPTRIVFDEPGQVLISDEPGVF